MALTKKKKGIILDTDMILLHWEKGFVDYFNEATNMNHIYRPFFENMANLLGFEKKEIKFYIEAFNHTDGFEYLDPMPGADNFLKTIELYNSMQQFEEDKIDIFLVTKCGTAPDIQHKRSMNLAREFGEFDYEITYLNIDESKMDRLMEIQQTHDVLMFIDDYTTNCDEGHSLGIPTYAVRCYHNEHLMHKKNYLNWCQDMNEATNELLTILLEERL